MAQAYWKVKRNGKWIWQQDGRIAQQVSKPHCECEHCVQKNQTHSTNGDAQ